VAQNPFNAAKSNAGCLHGRGVQTSKRAHSGNRRTVEGRAWRSRHRADPGRTMLERTSGRPCRSSQLDTRCRTSAPVSISSSFCVLMSASLAIRRGDLSAICNLRRPSTTPAPTAGFSRFYREPDIRWNFGPAVTARTGRLLLPADTRVGHQSAGRLARGRCPDHQSIHARPTDRHEALICAVPTARDG
jgi:hypothetical protein